MNKIPFIFILFLISVILFSCDTNQVANFNSSTDNTDKPTQTFTSTGSGEEDLPDISFDMSFTTSNNESDLEASGGGMNFDYDLTIHSPSSFYGTIETYMPDVEAATDPMKMNVDYQQHKKMIQKVSYDSDGLLQYEAGGNSYTHSLNNQEKEIIGKAKNTYQDAVSAYLGTIIKPDPILKTSNYAKSETKKTDLEAKKWLKKNGYKAKKIGNHLFQVSKKMKGEVTFTSVFNSETGRFVEEFTLEDKKGHKTNFKGNNRKKSWKYGDQNPGTKRYLKLSLKKKN